jgi:hypothetical protein
VQQFQPLRRYRGYARDVAARPTKAGDEAKPDRVTPVSKTIGMLVVAAFAVSAAEVVVATITVTRR